MGITTNNVWCRENLSLKLTHMVYNTDFSKELHINRKIVVLMLSNPLMLDLMLF